MNQRIYADFNGLKDSVKTDGHVALYLHSWWSLKDLSKAKLRLTEGIILNVYSDSDVHEDIEAKGTVCFDRKSHQWFVEFSENEIKYVPTLLESSSMEFPCWQCQEELSQHFSTNGFQLGDRCPHCEAEIHEPLKPPGISHKNV